MSLQNAQTPSSICNNAAAALALRAARSVMVGDDANAAIDILKTFELDARDPEVSFTLGVWTMGAGDHEQALDHFRRAAQLAPKVA